MARPSPGTQRVVALLDLLASNAGRAFSLTDLITALKMNRATCHALVNELVEAGYLYRTRDKLYVLGPAAAALARAASLGTTALDLALPEMKVLAHRHDAVCAAIFRDGGDVVLRERAISSSHTNRLANRETRWPLRPPFGSVFLAWSTERQVSAWFESLDPRPSLEEQERTREGMAFARENRFQFVVHRFPDTRLDGGIDWLYVRDPTQRPLEIETALDPQGSYWMTSMSSPVFDRQERVAFVLSLMGFSGPIAGERVIAVAQELKDACARIGAAAVF
ncbi:MAG: transcriptional regulator [Novosphingobium sp.]|nr:MAG: transcriptional regulator [Novosphingobium sp.]